MAMACVSVVVLVVHVVLSWLLILKLRWGLVGAAVTLNLSWWLIVFGQLAYIFAGSCGEAWSGFSWLAFSDLYQFIKLSFASALMLCLEFWYLMLLIVLTGHLKNPVIEVDAISICMNLHGWGMMIALGFNAAISKISVVVVSITSVAIGVVCMALVFITRDEFPLLFTNSSAVAKETSRIAILLGFTLLFNSLQPVLSGVAIGAGWQAIISYVNISCYYLGGLPIGLMLGFKFNLGVEGLWGGMIGGIFLQTLVLFGITTWTNWSKEAEQAESRIKKWGGSAGEE